MMYFVWQQEIKGGKEVNRKRGGGYDVLCMIGKTYKKILNYFLRGAHIAHPTRLDNLFVGSP